VVGWSAPLPRLMGTNRSRLTDYRYVGCSFRRCPQKWLAASPDTYASSDDPPTRIVQSSHEIVPALHGRELTRVLREAGVPVEFQTYRGDQHATQFELREWGPTVAFLRRWLEQAPARAAAQAAHPVPKVFTTAGD
jgi:acetyl esterase/lipase